MAYAEKHIINVITDGSGNATAYTPYVTGPVRSISYVKHGTAPFADGVDFTIIGDESLQSIWEEANVNASKTVAPRQATHSNVGVAALYAAAGTAVNDLIVVAQERIKISIAAGGPTANGRFIVVIG